MRVEPAAPNTGAAATTSLDGATTLLAELLDGSADDAVRERWERYMRGGARFRGVPMAGIRSAVRSVRGRLGVAGWSLDLQLDLADRWFGAPMSEDKLAAVLLVAEHLVASLEDAHADRLARPLRAGEIADWNVCDWYAVKALHRFLAPDGSRVEEGRARTLAGWSQEGGTWLPRAAVVAFVPSASTAGRQFDGYVDLVLATCAANLASPERFAHTGTGWVLRELSRAAPDAVAAFVERQPLLSSEARRMALARLRPGPYRRR